MPSDGDEVAKLFVVDRDILLDGPAAKTANVVDAIVYFHNDNYFRKNRVAW